MVSDVSLHPFVKDMYNNIYRKKRNVTAAIAGAVGTGKSYTGLALACMLDSALKKTKTVKEAKEWLEKRVIRDPSQLNNLLNEEKVSFGDCLIFDEAGTSADSREWWQYKNKVLRYNMQIFRNKRLVTIFTMPNLKFLDKQARDLIEFYIETINVNYNKKRVSSRVRKLQTNPHSGDTYKKRPRYIVGGKKVKFDFLNWPKPPEHICKAYEKFADKFKDKIREELQQQGEKMKEAEKVFDPKEKADEWIEEYGVDEIPTIVEVRAEMGLSQSKGRMTKAMIEKKINKQKEVKK